MTKEQEVPAVEAVVDPNADVTNPRMLVFPQDPTGFLYKFKAATLSAIERQNGNEEKHKQFMETLLVLAKFAKRRYVVQSDTRAADVAVAAEAAALLEVSQFAQEVPDDASTDGSTT